MPYLWIRNRTLVVSGTFAGDLKRKTYTLAAIDPGESSERYEIPGFFAQAPWGASVAGEVYNRGLLSDFGIKTSANNGFGVTDNDSDHTLIPDGDEILHTHAMGGTFSMSCDTEILLYYSLGDWNGYEAPPLNSWNIIERPRENGTATATITCGGVTSTATGLIPAGATQISDYRGSVTASFEAMGGQGSHTTDMIADQTVTIDMSWLSAAAQNTLDINYISNTYARVQVGSNNVSSHAKSDDVSQWRCTGTCLAAPPKAITIDGVLRALKVAYPNSLDVEYQVDDNGVQVVSVGGGAFTVSGTQYAWQVTADIYLNEVLVASDSASDYAYTTAACRVKQSSLQSNGEDDRHTRIMARAFAPYTSFNVSQQGTVVADQLTTLTPAGNYGGRWENVANTTLSVDVSGTGIVGTVAGGVGSFRRVWDWPAGYGMGGYAFLKVDMRLGAASGGSVLPYSVAMGTKTWTKDRLGGSLLAGTAGTPQYIDLCSPGNISDEADGADTRWTPLPTVDGPYFGVTNAPSLTFGNLASGHQWKLMGLQQERLGSVFFEPLGAFANWELEQTNQVGDVTTLTYVRRFLLGMTDGRQSMEITDAYKVVTSSGGGVSVTYEQVPLYGLVDQINANGNPTLEGIRPHAGWNGTAVAGTVDPANYGTLTSWLNNNRPATWLRGDGAMYPGTASGWLYPYEQRAETGTAQAAQCLLDMWPGFDWPPQVGDILQVANGGTTGAITVRVAWVARGGGHGLVLTEDGPRATGGTVFSVETASGSLSGSGSIDAFGWYRTGSPFGRGSANVRVYTGDADYERTWTHKKFWRAVLRAGTATWVDYDVSPAGRHVRAFVKNGRIWVGHASNASPSSWTDHDTGVAGYQPCIQFHDFSGAASAQRAYISYTQGTAGTASGTIALAYTADEGRSVVGVATIFSSGKWSRTHITRDGRKLCYAWDGSAIIGKIYDGQDQVLVPQFTAVASSVDDDAFDIHEYYVGGGGWRLKLTYRSGGSIIDRVSSDGVTFS